MSVYHVTYFSIALFGTVQSELSAFHFFSYRKIFFKKFFWTKQRQKKKSLQIFKELVADDDFTALGLSEDFQL